VARHPAALEVARSETHHPACSMNSTRADDRTSLPQTLAGVIDRYGHHVFKNQSSADMRPPTCSASPTFCACSTNDRPGIATRWTATSNITMPPRLMSSSRSCPRCRIQATAGRLALHRATGIARHLARPGLGPRATPLRLVAGRSRRHSRRIRARSRTRLARRVEQGLQGHLQGLINRARCDHWNDDARREGSPPASHVRRRPDPARPGSRCSKTWQLASLLGLSHCERNGHHYVDGFGDAPAIRAASLRARTP